MSRRIMRMAALGLAVLTLASCSVRPQGETVILHENLPQPTISVDLNLQPYAKLRKATYYSLQDLGLLGWAGDDLLLWGSTGLYTADIASQSDPVPLLSLTDQWIYLASLSPDGTMAALLIDSPEGPGLYLVDLANPAAMTQVQGLDSALLVYYMTDFGMASDTIQSQQATLWSEGHRYLSLQRYYQKSETSPYPLVVDTQTAQLLDITDENLKQVTYVYDLNEQRQELLALLQDKNGEPSLQVVPLDGGSAQSLSSGEVAEKASMIDDQNVITLMNMTLTVTNRSLPGQARIYSDVYDYALSADRSCICLLKYNNTQGIDLYTARFQDGEILDEQLIFKDIETFSGSVFFAAVSPAICLTSVNYMTTETDTIASDKFERQVLILQFS